MGDRDTQWQRDAGSSDESSARSAAADSASPMQDLEALRLILEGTARSTGEEFLHSLVRSLATAVDAQFAFVAEFAESQGRVRTLAFSADGSIEANLEWDLAGTPCQDVVRGNFCHHTSGVSRLFPRDTMLVERGIESYLGVPLLDAGGRKIGHLAVFDRRPMPIDKQRTQVFRILASRAAAELERVQIERRLRASERQFRDLFEEAPIAYVYEETSTRFVSANRAFMDLLGLGPGDVPGTMGLSLVAPTPSSQRPVLESLRAEQAGTGLAAIEIELRRKDNGQPVWVQRWSKPEPDGKHTRTMIVDITARVLAEREQTRLHQHNLYLREEITEIHNFEQIVGASAAIQNVLRQIEQVAATDATVLITGETGTGKELIARAVHSLSARKAHALIKVNCAALPSGLVESELFGHEKGAFTGALARRIGRFELADKGTIFLDEIGEMPADVQVKLLRVLQEHEFEAVGSTRTLRADVRVIAATNRNLEAAVAEHQIRPDLYFRLNVFPVRLPPLRERREDIPLLVNFLVIRMGTKLGKKFTTVDGASMTRLRAYPWPGNVRELENVIERAAILSTAPVLEVEMGLLVPQAAGAGEPAAPVGDDTASVSSADSELTLADFERKQIREALASSLGVIEGPRGAAALLGLHPNTLRSKLKRLGITRLQTV